MSSESLGAWTVRYGAKTGISHVQCWVHLRRHVFGAQMAEPEAAADSLDLNDVDAAGAA